jgi:hypothetical protein
MSKPRTLLICIDNEGYEASLELRKIYVAVPDRSGAKCKFVRVVDESGEDYLYPSSMFVTAILPADVRRAVLRVA